MGQILISSSPICTLILDDNGGIIQIYQETDNNFFTHLNKFKDITTDSSTIKELCNGKNIFPKVDLLNPILKQIRINRFSYLIENTGLISDSKDYKNKLRKSALNSTFEKIKQHSSKKDEILSQVVHGIDDLQKTINLTGSRLKELYALHFPEITDTISNQVTLAKIVTKTPNRNNISTQHLQQFSLPKEKIEFILSAAKKSIGGDLAENDLTVMSYYAETIIHSNENKLKLEKWIDDEMEKYAPNLTAVSGANVGARIISAMGGLINIAKTHASKIQIIGAEKALYSAMRGRGTPPKHGILFQIPEIGNSPHHIRGKLSRAFANSIVIAARFDCFGDNFKGDELRAELKELELRLRGGN